MRMDADYLGQVALIGIVVFGIMYVVVNRRSDSRRTPIAETMFLGLWFISIGAGISYANDPEDWLHVTAPTTITSATTTR